VAEANSYIDSLRDKVPGIGTLDQHKKELWIALVEFRQMRREDVTGKKRIQACPYRSFGRECRARGAVRGLLNARKVRRGKLVEPRALRG